MKANLVQKVAKMDHRAIVKFQIFTYCFMRNISLSHAGLECLASLAIVKEANLAEFCNNVVDEGIFKTAQTVRNFLTQSERQNLIMKKGSTKKTVSLNSELAIQTTGNIILEYKMVYVVIEEG